MKWFMKFWKVILLDTLGIIFIIAAPLTGWLPGPGGIPLLIIGLSLLAVNHTWAQRYVDMAKKYADKLGDLIFVKNPVVQLLYDAIAIVLFAVSIYLFYLHSAVWMISAAFIAMIVSAALFFGNRQRFQRLKRFWSRN